MRRHLLLLAGLACLLFAATASRANDPWLRAGADGRPQVQFYFFWLATCPHCQEARPFIERLPQGRPWLRLHALEAGEAANLNLYRELAQPFGQEAAVPAFLFCGQMRSGWQSAATTGAEIERAVDACGRRVLAGGGAAAPAAASAAAENRIEVPGLGSIDAAALSLPTLTLVLAGLDAFNPCAFFVLLFLLSMMAHQHSRGRMLAVGGVFVFFSGFMYFAFMAAWLSVFQLIGQLAWVTTAAGVVALLVGALNAKDFFAFKQGVSLSISDAGRQDIFRRSRAILSARRLPAMLAATALLAVAANFYELLCTAGFPLVYTRILTLADLAPAARYLYLACYNLIYVLPLAAIVAVFAHTLGARKLDERQGRLLKLLSGLMMLELGALLLLAPERAAEGTTGFALIAVAGGITWLAAKATRKAA